MRTPRALVAIDPRRFGRARALSHGVPPEQRTLAEDAQLFAATFAAGFVFVSILIG